MSIPEKNIETEWQRFYTSVMDGGKPEDRPDLYVAFLCGANALNLLMMEHDPKEFTRIITHLSNQLMAAVASAKISTFDSDNPHFSE